jgi:hypothetical protein
MIITVATPLGMNLTFDVEPTIKIREIKEMIYQQMGIPRQLQRFVYHGEELRNESTLEAARIQDGEKLFLSVGLRDE